MTPENSLIPSPPAHVDLQPVISIETAVERYNTLKKYVESVLRPDYDFGIIPGTKKATLLKPGAEKLTTLFGLSKRLDLIEKIEDWTGEQHGVPFFYYLYRCSLYLGTLLIAQADGSCNSMESKYRWRNLGRLCPACGNETIIKGKAEYGGGWVCFKNKGGCGAKFRDGESAIEEQTVGKVANQDTPELVNTIQKIAAKRALIATTLLACNASEFFTQDTEDIHDPHPGGSGPSSGRPPLAVNQEVAQTRSAAAGAQDPYTIRDRTAPEPTERDRAIRYLQQNIKLHGFAIDAPTYEEFIRGLVGSKLSEADDNRVFEAALAVEKAAGEAEILRWNSGSWQCSSLMKAYSMGLIAAHAHLDGFHRTKAVTGDPTLHRSHKQIETMNANLLSWVRPEATPERKEVAA